MKEKKTGVILLAILAVLVIAADVFIYMNVYNKGGNSSSNTNSNTNTSSNQNNSSTTPVSGKKVDKETAEAAFRENTDIRRAVEETQYALKFYKRDNEGDIPQKNGDSTHNWNFFIEEYVEKGYRADKLFDFSEKYKFIPCDFTKNECKKPNSLTWETDKNVIYAATHATCNNNNVVSSTDAKDVAMYAAMNPDSRIRTYSYTCIKQAE